MFFIHFFNRKFDNFCSKSETFVLNLKFSEYVNFLEKFIKNLLISIFLDNHIWNFFFKFENVLEFA
jgi:hypothetical protein